MSSFEIKRVLVGRAMGSESSDPPWKEAIYIMTLSKGKSTTILTKIGRLRDTGEGGVGFQDDKLCDVGLELMPTNLKQI